MKKFVINCDFGGQLSPFAIYVGKPEQGHHPLHFQAEWLSQTRGGTIPSEVMEAVTKLQELAQKNNVSLEELCVYALGTEEQQAELESTDSQELSEDNKNPKDIEEKTLQKNPQESAEPDKQEQQ